MYTSCISDILKAKIDQTLKQFLCLQRDGSLRLCPGKPWVAGISLWSFRDPLKEAMSSGFVCGSYQLTEFSLHPLDFCVSGRQGSPSGRKNTAHPTS